MMRSGIFISHSSADSSTAARLCADIEAEGLTCWLAPRDIVPGADWPAAIVAALDRCEAVVVVVSPASNGSAEVAREVHHAGSLGKPIIPTFLGQVELSPALDYYLGAAHRLDIAGGGPEATQRVINAIRYHVGASSAVLRDDSGAATASHDLSEQGSYVEEEPPFLDRFIDRDADFEQLMGLPEDVGLVLLLGLAGVGKTQLAARLRTAILDQGKAVFWRRIYPGDRFESVATDLAGFLWTLGHQAPGRELAQRAAPARLIHVLGEALTESGAVTMLDNYEVIESPELDELLALITEKRGPGRVIVTSRVVPSSITVRHQARNSYFSLELDGFPPEITNEYVRQSGVELAAETVQAIHDRTGGHPLLLDLLVSQIVSYGLDDDDIVESLSDFATEVDDFLLRNVYANLGAAEVAIMRYLSVSMLALTRADLERVLEGEHNLDEIRTALSDLERKRLVRRSKLTFIIHSVVRDFVYGHIDHVEGLHSRLADLLLLRSDQSGKSIQEAHRQLELAQRKVEADELLVERFQPLWRGGYRGWAKEALDSVAHRADVGADGHLDALVLLGRVYLETCEWDEVIAAYAEARSIAAAGNRRLDLARITNNEAEVHGRRGSLDTAVQFFIDAEDELRAVDRDDEAAFALLNRSAFLARYGRLADAERLSELLDQLDGVHPAIRLKLPSLRGLLRFEMADLEGSERACLEDLSASETNDDSNGAARAWNNLAIVKAATRELDPARALLDSSVDFNRNQGDIHAVAQSEANLGLCAQLAGDTELAASYYLRAGATFASIRDNVSLWEIQANALLLPPTAADALGGLFEQEPVDGAWNRPHPHLAGLRFLWNLSYGYLPP